VRRFLATWTLFAAALPAALSCGTRSGPRPDVAGTWRAVIQSPGGELPFTLRLDQPVTRDPREGRLAAVVVNGEEVLPIDTARIDGDKVILRFEQYDSEISARLSEDRMTMTGTWVRQAGRRRPVMVFTASRGEAPRFGLPVVASAGIDGDITGSWDVLFTDDEGTSPARGEFRQQGERLLGTFLTPTGDYRFLEGDYRAGHLRLSCFDGGHAFLFHAVMDADGMTGDFWSRSSYHATWTARRAAAGSTLPDPYATTTLKNPSGRLRFSFPDLAGRMVSSSDAMFAGKVVLVDVFGSWCPNCNDQAPVLAGLYRAYHEQGLEIVGLAYEMTGDRARDAIFVGKYAERHGVVWPLLLAGTSDKSEASQTLPDLSGVLAFPTLIFIGRDGRVAAIHTGFEGPGTGRHFDELKARYDQLVKSLL